MITIRAYRLTVPLALAAVLGLLAAASAQQSPPAKDAKPAAKSAKEKSAPPPAQKKSPAAATPAAPGGGQPSLLGQFGDWGAYTASQRREESLLRAGEARLAGTEPPGRPRDPA